MTAIDTRPMDVDTFLDTLQFNRFHLTVLVLCTILAAIDGYELYVVGWILPDLARDFGVPNTAITSAMVAQQVGMVIGAFAVPPIADRLGRPRLLLLCYAGIALSALAILTTRSLTPFTICRFVAGLCGTALIPILVTLASETAPQRLRSTMSTITVCGTMIGALLGALMQAFVLEPFGWRGAFWIAFAMPVAMLPFIHFLLPESMRARAARNPADPMIQTLAQRMQPRGAAPVVLIPAVRPNRRHAPAMLTEILGRGRRMKTFLIWAISISSFVFITAGQWKTTIFKDVIGLPWPQIAAINATNTAAGFVGMLTIGFFIDRLGFKRVMVGAFLLAALGTAMIGVFAPGVGMFAAVAIMAMFQHGGQAGIAALAAALYPPSSRATGVGWTWGAGRVASIFAPLFGPFVLGNKLGAVGIFALLAVPLMSAGLLTLWLMSVRGAPAIRRPGRGHG